MVDWNQIAKDYFMFIIFVLVVIVYLFYKYMNQRSIKKQAEEASHLMNLQNSPPDQPQKSPYWTEPLPPIPPKMPIKDAMSKLNAFKDTSDEIPVEPEEEEPKKVEKEEDFQAAFDDIMGTLTEKSAPQKQKNLMNALNDITEEMRSSSELLQGTLEDDLATLKAKLQLITTRKEEIKKYGKLLGELYTRYQHREKQLSIMVVGLERLEELKDSGINPPIGQQ